jgi:hypothetical protein
MDTRVDAVIGESRPRLCQISTMERVVVGWEQRIDPD